MWISCFSTGQRASSSLLDTVAKFICTMPDGDSRIAKKNQEQLFLRGNGPADVRRMFSYPSSVSGLKGVGGKIIILEEASRLDEAVFTEARTSARALCEFCGAAAWRRWWCRCLACATRWCSQSARRWTATTTTRRCSRRRARTARACSTCSR